MSHHSVQVLNIYIKCKFNGFEDIQLTGSIILNYRCISVHWHHNCHLVPFLRISLSDIDKSSCNMYINSVFTKGCHHILAKFTSSEPSSLRSILICIYAYISHVISCVCISCPHVCCMSFPSHPT